MIRKLLALVAVGAGALTIQAQPRNGTPMSTAASGSPLYYPAHDPTIVFGDELLREVAYDAFGWYGPVVLPLSLDQGFAPDETVVTGANGIGESFSIEVAMYCQFVDVAGARFSTWCGRIHGPAGISRVVYGLYDESTPAPCILPVVRCVDEELDERAFLTMLDVRRGGGARSSQCDLDEDAQLQEDANQLKMQACIDNGTARFLSLEGICVVGGGASCLFTGGIGCIAGMICMASVGIDTMRFCHDFDAADALASGCLCLESAFRADHPGQSAPTDCGDFVCPSPPSLIPGLRL